jgi:hypothetical protein
MGRMSRFFNTTERVRVEEHHGLPPLSRLDLPLVRELIEQRETRT